MDIEECVRFNMITNRILAIIQIVHRRIKFSKKIGDIFFKIKFDNLFYLYKLYVTNEVNLPPSIEIYTITRDELYNDHR